MLNAPMTVYRAIWISDVHLGSTACQAEFLLDFLKNNESEKLYLVGDIIDGWELKKTWYWPQAHNDVIQKILRKSRKGTKVIYIPGNHDEGAKQFINNKFADIRILKEAYHTTKNGQKLWIIHGDLFDSIRTVSKWLEFVGDEFYKIILWINEKLNNIRRYYGMNYWSFSKHIKSKISKANQYIQDFEKFMVRETKLKKCQGVVCGHIHKPEIKSYEEITYYNDGDWVENLTALVETKNGEMKLIQWADQEHFKKSKKR